MKCSLVSLIFLTWSLVFPILLFSSISLHWSLRKAFLSLLAILWNSAFKWVYFSFSPLLFASRLFTAICKASSDSHFAALHFFSWGWSWSLSPVGYHEPPSIVHQALCLSDLVQFALIHETNIPGSYAILLSIASDLASITSHIHSWVLFLLWLCPFILSGVICPLISSSILGTYWPGEFLFQYPIILPFHTVHGFSRQEHWSGLPFPFPVDHIYQNSPPWLSTICLGWPYRAWFSFIELDKAVVHVIRLTSFLWLWFQCVCPLMPSCNTYHLTWVSLTLGVGFLFTAAPAKRSCCSLPWTRGISSLLPFLTLNVG